LALIVFVFGRLTLSTNEKKKETFLAKIMEIIISGLSNEGVRGIRILTHNSWTGFLCLIFFWNSPDRNPYVFTRTKPARTQDSCEELLFKTAPLTTRGNTSWKTINQVLQYNTA
jgi:hypothetical protein